MKKKFLNELMLENNINIIESEISKIGDEKL